MKAWHLQNTYNSNLNHQMILKTKSTYFNNLQYSIDYQLTKHHRNQKQMINFYMDSKAFKILDNLM